MESFAESFTISIPQELEEALAQAQSEYFVGVSRSEMILELIQRGLDATHPNRHTESDATAPCTGTVHC